MAKSTFYSSNMLGYFINAMDTIDWAIGSWKTYSSYPQMFTFGGSGPAAKDS